MLRDRSRNILFNHLGLGEDEMKMVLRPDCADLPYFLRAYFAFKMGLPFGYSKCTRGGGGRAPKCPQWFSIQNLEPPPPPPRSAARAASRRGDARGFGNAPAAASAAPGRGGSGLAASFGRTMRDRSATASIPDRGARGDCRQQHRLLSRAAVSRRRCGPGTVYADPYGHILMIVRRVPQTEGAAGVILAVDGQPDGTVARKRFWRGNFLFAQDPALGGPGFKRFRPVVRDSERRLAAADQRRDREEPAIRRFLARPGASSASRTSTTAWTT